MQLKVEMLRSQHMIRLYKKSASFFWSLDNTSTIKGNLDLKADIIPEELLTLAKELKCPVKGSKIISLDMDTYNRLIVYAAVRPAVNSQSGITSLTWLVKGMTGWDAHYWASRFRELWWEYGSYRSLSKAVKAFKLFFGLE